MNARLGKQHQKCCFLHYLNGRPHKYYKMRFISESILDDYTPQESNSASRLASNQSRIYSPDVHPGEYQHAILVDWVSMNKAYPNDWIEDALSIYASRFSICLIKSKEDVERLQSHVQFKKYIPMESILSAQVYAIIEFDMPDGRPENLYRMMLNLLYTGECMCYTVAEWHNPHTAIYVEKNKSNTSVCQYVWHLFHGTLNDSRYKETVSTKLYWFTHPDETQRLFEEVKKCMRFVNKLSSFYKRKIEKDYYKNR